MSDMHREDWCLRLEQAVTDGRFLEDPAHWRAHVNQCRACRETVEGVFLLRDFVGQARMGDDLGGQPPLVAENVVAEAISRHRAERQRLLTFWSMGACALLVVGGMFLHARSPSPGPATARTELAGLPSAKDDPIAYAIALDRRAFPTQDLADSVLKEDEALRREFIGALDHPNSYVRQVALSGLINGGIDLDPRRIEQVLANSNETMTGALAASSQDAERVIAQTLAQRRTQTLLSALAGAGTQAARGGKPVRPDAIEPYVVHVDPAVQVSALGALRQDPSYQPGEVVERLLARDDDVDVRAEAGSLLIARRGEPAVEAVVAQLRAKPDWVLEMRLVPHLGKSPAGLALARERTEDPATPMALALLHAQMLARKGERAAVLRLIPKAAADGDIEAVRWAATFAKEWSATEARPALQARWRKDHERWRADAPSTRQAIAQSLVTWDEASNEEARLDLALEVLEDLGPITRAALREALERLARSSLPSVRQRAERLRVAPGTRD
jgi:hypothetical protein